MAHAKIAIIWELMIQEDGEFEIDHQQRNEYKSP